MIGYLKGQVVKKGADFIVLTTGSVGYLVYAPLAKLDLTQSEQTLFIKHIFREDDELLFGFPTWELREAFEDLTSIQGVGPKTALTLLNQHNFEDIKQAFIAGNKDFFTKISGIGPKTAEKLIFELRRKFEAGDPLAMSTNPKASEVIAALKELGYNTNEARSSLEGITDWEQPLSDLIKQALKQR